MSLALLCSETSKVNDSGSLSAMLTANCLEISRGTMSESHSVKMKELCWAQTMGKQMVPLMASNWELMRVMRLERMRAMRSERMRAMRLEKLWVVSMCCSQ